MATETPPPEESAAPPQAAAPEGEVPSQWELILERHKKSILVAVVAVVVAIFAGIIIEHGKQSRRDAAAMAFSGASTIAEYEAVIRDYPGTAAAGNALLMKADLERKENKLNESQATLTSFVTSYRGHPFFHQGVFALGAQAQDKGKLEEAENYYQQIIDDPEAADLAPLAIIRKGDIEYERGKYEAARSLYQSVGPTYPGTPFTFQADQKLRREKLLPPAPAPAPPVSATTPAAIPAGAPVPVAPAPAKPSAIPAGITATKEAATPPTPKPAGKPEPKAPPKPDEAGKPAAEKPAGKAKPAPAKPTGNQ